MVFLAYTLLSSYVENAFFWPSVRNVYWKRFHVYSQKIMLFQYSVIWKGFVVTKTLFIQKPPLWHSRDLLSCSVRCRLRSKCDGTRAETGFRLSAKVTSQFSRLLAAEVCASAVVMLDTPCSEVVWRVLASNSIRQFPLNFSSRASPCAITFQLDSNSCVFDEVYNNIILSGSCIRRFPQITKCMVCLKRSWTMIYAIILHSKSTNPLISINNLEVVKACVQYVFPKKY